MKDFTLAAYRQLLLSIKEAGYSFFTFEEWCEGRATGRSIILRHDVDLKAGNSLATARIEAELGICATYYFRIIPQSNQSEIILSIAELGHEIGYHYEDLSLFKGDVEKAIDHFKLQLDYFRLFYPVRTICMHGSPTSKWDNRDIWKTYNYSDYGITGEPYLDFLPTKLKMNQGISYFTDTARMWDGDKYNIRDKIRVMNPEVKVSGINLQNIKRDIDPTEVITIHSTFDLINRLKTNPTDNVIMITTHPQRWTDNSIDWYTELLKQKIKNRFKKFIVGR